MRKTCPTISLLLSTVLLATSSSATTESDDPELARQRAEALFNEGRAAVKANDYRTACPKFEESLKLARRAGTLFNLAQCEEHEGRLVTAVQYYKEGIVVLEPGDPRLGPSKEQLATVQPRVPFLTIKLASKLPAEGRVTLDGREVEGVDVEFAVNPGNHEIKVLVAKHADTSRKFEIAEGEHAAITVKVGARLPDPPPPPNPLTPQRVATIAAFGVGGLGLLGAAITGGLLVSTKGRVDEGCPGKVCATAAGFAAADQGKPLLVANTMTWGVGIVGVGLGAFLLLYKPKKDSAKPTTAHSFVLGPDFVGVQGSF